MTSLTMPAPGVHEAVYKPRRLVTPAELAARAKLEMIHQPLYSTVALDAAAIPPSTTLFTYALGATVPGAGLGAVASSLFHTNMETAGFLAAPKIHIVQSLSVHMNVLTAGPGPGLPDPSVEAASSDHELIEDLLTLNYATSLVFRVGPKTYVRHSNPFLPSNTGIEGIAAVTNFQQAAAAPQGLRILSGYTCGPPFTWPIYPVLIASQQSFSAELQAQATTEALNDPHWVTVYLDGVLGREVS